MKKLSLLREKLWKERMLVVNEMKSMETELAEMKATHEGQLRLIKNVTGHAKNQAALLNDQSQTQATLHDGVSQEVLRNERLAKQINRS